MSAKENLEIGAGIALIVAAAIAAWEVYKTYKVKTLAEAQAQELYGTNYYNPINYDLASIQQLPDGSTTSPLPAPGTYSQPIIYENSSGQYTGAYGGYDTAPVLVISGNGTEASPWSYTSGWQGAGWYVNVPNQSTNTPVYIGGQGAYTSL